MRTLRNFKAIDSSEDEDSFVIDCVDEESAYELIKALEKYASS